MNYSGNNSRQQQQKSVKQAYGSRGGYVIRKSLKIALLLPILVLFIEQFILTLIFDALEFSYEYITGVELLWDYLWMTAVTFAVFSLFHWLEWNQSAASP